MQYRTLGKDGPRISTIGFGAWAMGGSGWSYSWGSQDDEESTRAVHAALDAGVTFFDTAAVYGLGHSEEVLGRALGPRRKDVVLATKCGLVWDENKRIRRNGNYASVLQEVEQSLRRLGTDWIDLYQLHWPDTESGSEVEETMRAMDELVRSGKVRWVGLSNFDVAGLRRALGVRHVDSLQPPYSLLARQVEEAVLPFCQANGIGVVAYSPLASGLLSGRYGPDTRFEPGDWRSRSAAHTGEGLRRNLALVERLRPIAQAAGRSVAQLAIAWVLAHPAMTAAIVGVRHPGHVRDALPAADWNLSADERLAIDAALTA